MTKRLLLIGFFLQLTLVFGACGGGANHAAPASPLATANFSNSALSDGFTPDGSSDWPLFVNPRPGDPKVDVTQPITWTPANNARAYELQIGTTLEGNDVFDSGIVTTTSVAMPPLPASVVLYARVRAILNGWGDASPAGHWSLGSYTAFRTDNVTPASTFTNVGPTKTLPAGAPLEWNANPLAVGYRLEVAGAMIAGTTASNFSFADIGETGDSGEIHTTHAFIVAPTNGNVTATLYTIYLGGRTVSSRMQFTAVGGAPTFAQQYALGRNWLERSARWRIVTTNRTGRRPWPRLSMRAACPSRVVPSSCRP